MDADTGSMPSGCDPDNATLVVGPVSDDKPNEACTTASLDGASSSPAIVAESKKERKPRAPRVANSKPKAPTIEQFVDARFFAGMSSTLKQLQRRDREFKLSSLQIV